MLCVVAFGVLQKGHCIKFGLSEINFPTNDRVPDEYVRLNVSSVGA